MGESHEDRMWAMLSHLLAAVFNFIPPLIIYLARGGQSKFVAFHALQSLFFQLARVGIVFLLIRLEMLHWFIMPFWWGTFAYTILACVQAYAGETFEYVIIGKWARRIVGI